MRMCELPREVYHESGQDAAQLMELKSFCGPVSTKIRRHSLDDVSFRFHRFRNCINKLSEITFHSSEFSCCTICYLQVML